MGRYLLLSLTLLCVSAVCRGRTEDFRSAVCVADSTVAGKFSKGLETAIVTNDSLPVSRKSFFQRLGQGLSGFFHEFNRFDTTYIEPQHYRYTVMLQNTNTYEMYRLTTKAGQSITFAPEISYRVGPYVGWRWVFLGYTVDLTHISASKNNRNRKEFDLSLYSSMLGIDLFWRETGNNYKIQSLDLGEGVNTDPIKGRDFDGFKSSIRGFNLYYIFNHHRFSYPAAYSQSTVQRRSAGSVLLGIGYTRHTVRMDWEKLSELVASTLDAEAAASLDSDMLFGNIQYTDFNVNGGYSYNWVFAKNWLFNASLSLALAYNYTKGDLDHEHFIFRDFSLHNFNVDGIGRFGIVWNNTRWYAGMSTILHAYNYSKSRFSTNNFFGSVNFYLGFNFGRK